MADFDSLDLSVLRSAVDSGIAFRRSLAELQPAGGPGDKVFPATYEGATYAFEERVIDGQRIPCVLLDSVPVPGQPHGTGPARRPSRGDAQVPAGAG